MSKVKIVTVGDGAVGKTSLLVTYSTENFPEKHVPTVFDNFEDDIVIDGQSIKMELWDTAGQEDYDRLRPVCYKGCDAFIVCFSIVRPESLEHVKSKWIPEIHKFCNDAPYVLVGTKMDMRGDNDSALTVEAGQAMAKEIGATEYIECSAKSQTGLKRVMVEAAKIAQTTRQTKKKKCILL